MRKILSSLIVALSFSMPVLAADPKPPASTPKLLEKGKAAYAANCASCHGASGQGDGVVGKLLNPKPRDFGKSVFKKGDKVEQIFVTLTNGLDGTAMVGFKHLSEEDRWGLAYHVKSMRVASSSTKK